MQPSSIVALEFAWVDFWACFSSWCPPSSGFATPIANMPKAVQYITLIEPLRYFLVILRASFLEGAGASLLWPQYWPLATIGIVSMIVAGRLFRGRSG